MDKVRCPHVGLIFDQDDENVYKKDPNISLTECSELMPPQTRKTCKMCYYKRDLLISCFNDTERIDVEDHGQIHNVSEICEYQTLHLNAQMH